MKVSIITPFFEGAKYLTSYLSMIRDNKKYIKSGDELEVLLINDSPWVTIKNVSADVRLINNETNIGIHASRVRGLLEATGEYIIFLDQDDVLQKEAVATFLEAAQKEEKDIYVSNAFLEQKEDKQIWYRSQYHIAQIDNLSAYVNVGTQIISPGQCMIKKEAIPDAWKNNICKKNGADDYYLWLLMLEKKASFSYIDKILYTHTYTAENISADTKKTDASSYEFIAFLREDKEFPTKVVNRLETMVMYKAQFREGNLLQKGILSIRHFPIFWRNIIFKIRTKTKYGFNR